MKTVRKMRSTTLTDNNVGKIRQDLYSQAHIHIKVAMEQGYYLEVITLVESLVSDRLESFITQTTGEDFSFRTLGELIEKVRKLDVDEKIKNLVIGDLDQWRHLRNKSLHEMAKLEQGTIVTWQNRLQALPGIANDGLAILRKIDDRYKTLKAREKKKKISIPANNME